MIIIHSKDRTKYYAKHLDCEINLQTYVDFMVNIIKQFRKQQGYELNKAGESYNKGDISSYFSHLECYNRLLSI